MLNFRITNNLMTKLASFSNTLSLQTTYCYKYTIKICHCVTTFSPVTAKVLMCPIKFIIWVNQGRRESFLLSPIYLSAKFLLMLMISSILLWKFCSGVRLLCKVVGFSLDFISEHVYSQCLRITSLIIDCGVLI